MSLVALVGANLYIQDLSIRFVQWTHNIVILLPFYFSSWYCVTFFFFFFVDRMQLLICRKVRLLFSFPLLLASIPRLQCQCME